MGYSAWQATAQHCEQRAGSIQRRPFTAVPQATGCSIWRGREEGEPAQSIEHRVYGIRTRSGRAAAADRALRRAATQKAEGEWVTAESEDIKYKV